MTVKLQSGKVILKDGKVSCSCCEEPGECCMYPAQALADGLYTADDLPDAVDFTYSASGNTFGPYTLTRTGTTFIGGPENEVKIELADDIWVSGDGGGGIESFPCLINETFQPSGGGGYEITVEDQFADTYTVSGSISGTVTRESVCVWRGAGLTLTNFGYQWKVNGNNKSGLQNTPVGTYAGGFSVS